MKHACLESRHSSRLRSVFARDMPSRVPHRQKVAIIGSGMAGLVTAYLLRNDTSGRFDVEIFERVGGALCHCQTNSNKRWAIQQDKVSLDSASLTLPTEYRIHSEKHRVDLPMRAFADGYYTYLVRMYNYLGVHYASPRFTYTLSSSLHGARNKTRPYFIHSSNHHQIPPLRPETLSLGSWLLELVYLVVCYSWFTACCFLVRPKAAAGPETDETFRQYLEKIMLPRYYVKYYLLPLMSSVTTCPHDALLDFPAMDIIEYEKKTFRQPHYTIVGGVRTIQTNLSKGQRINLLSTVTTVQNVGAKTRVSWKDGKTGNLNSALYDHVIMAVTPNVVGSIYSPLRGAMAAVPTVQVPTVVHFDSARLSGCHHSVQGRVYSDPNGQTSQPIHMCSNTNATESTHEYSPSVFITTSPIVPIDPDKILHSVTFTRVLRTPESRDLLRRIFGENEHELNTGKAMNYWRNGDENVWLVGGWCWDGMVMLEGCILSAMRVANSVGVDIPW